MGRWSGSEGDYFDCSSDILGAKYNAQHNTILAPGVGEIHGMAWLDDGDVVVGSGCLDSLLRVSPVHGTNQSISGDLGGDPYGVVRGPDGFIYTAVRGVEAVLRVDPDSGEVLPFLSDEDLPTGPRSINFNRDFTKFYVSSEFDDRVFVVDLDAHGDPVLPVRLFADSIGPFQTFSFHDALGVDACDNVYIPEFSSRDFYRISPTGEVVVYRSFTEHEYGHGVRWGPGTGGWRTDAIYMPQPYNHNQVLEVVVGVPSREFEGTVIPVVDSR